MKIFLSKINESWIVDRVRSEWYTYNPSISTEQVSKADVLWIISPWLWKKVPKRHLINKKVVCSIYHIDFKSFDENERKDFFERDKYVDFYHVISVNTKKQLQTLTNKKIVSIPFWVNQNYWFEIPNRNKLRNKYNLKNSDYLVGSFQRDTEGNDLISPKLIKGPDIFLEIITNLFKNNKNLKVVLTGKRRNYLINNFEKLEIPYEYFEMVNLKNLNELYNILDLYIVSSRVEGGPQAILECSRTKTPIVSTDVGVAPEILHKDSIYEVGMFEKAKPNVEYAFKNSEDFIIPNGMKKFIDMFQDYYEN